MKRIIISRTDAIGDVVLTLPLAGIIKKSFPETTVIFFGRSYTKPVIDLSANVDEFIDYDEFSILQPGMQAAFLKKVKADCILHTYPRSSIAKAAKQAGIPKRIGTSHRLYHLFTCNKLIHFSRKHSDLHESQLNVKLLKGLSLTTSYSLEELVGFYGIKNSSSPPINFSPLLTPDKINIVIHPRSHGSAREWGLNNYRELIVILKDRVTIFISGSVKEKEELEEWLSTLPPGIHDMTGRLSLSELIAFLAVVDGIVAGSTGPLHIAAALGRHALGIFPPIRPMHAGRWAPMGKHAEYITFPKICNDCQLKPGDCSCLKNISPQQVANLIVHWKK